MEFLAKSQVLMFFLVLVSGDHNFLFEKPIKCVQHPANNILETITEAHVCSVRSFKHCFHDDHTYITKPSLQTGFCGFIASDRIKSSQGFTWRITTSHTVWLHFMLFKLYIDTFPCSPEYMILEENNDVKNIFCGYRVPWHYYAQTSTITVEFVSDYKLFGMYKFEIYFQEGNKLAHKVLKFESSTAAFKYLDHEPGKYNFITMYILTERWRIINLQIDNNCTLISSESIRRAWGQIVPSHSRANIYSIYCDA